MIMPMFARKSPAERHFDHWAPSYDRDLSHFRYSAPRVLFDYLAPYKRDAFHLLDIGIGTGLSSALFRKAWPDAVITGVDISENMIRLCRDKGIADHLCLCDAGRDALPFAKNSFDAVICAGVLEYIKYPNRLLANIADALKRGGVALLAFETPKTRPIYKGRLLSFITDDDPGCTRVTRLTLKGIPRIYSRYLYDRDVIAKTGALYGLNVMEQQHFAAYAPGRDETVTYELLVMGS
jgi:ubiquinone/menaquinone biosynthesis C-methylase UbiE